MLIRFAVCSVLALQAGLHSPAAAERMEAPTAPGASTPWANHVSDKEAAFASAWSDRHDPDLSALLSYGTDAREAENFLDGRVLGESKETVETGALNLLNADLSGVADAEDPPRVSATEPGELGLLGVGLMATSLIALKRAARKQEFPDPFAGSA